jgi:hypothetical protein
VYFSVPPWSVHLRVSSCPLDVDLGAFAQVLLGDLCQAVIENDDAVPFGLFLALVGMFVAPALGGGDRQVGDATAGLKRADLGVFAEVADEYDFVDRTGHEYFSTDW